jgi:hypothetical protein
LKRSIALCVGVVGVAATILLQGSQAYAVAALGVGLNEDVTVDFGNSGTVETVAPYDVTTPALPDLPPPPDDRINARCTIHAGVSAPYTAVSNGYAIVGKAYIDCGASDVTPIDISMTVRLTRNGTTAETGGQACTAANHCAVTTNTYSCTSSCRASYQAILTSTITWALPLRQIPSHCTKSADNQLQCSLTSHSLTIR